MSSWKTCGLSGATSWDWQLQWSHDDVVVENAECTAAADAGLRTASMEPRRCRRGKRRGGGQRGFSFPASMEPRRCRRGKRVVVPAGRAQEALSFNGATTMSSWKTTIVITNLNITELLQWSHDDVVVENGQAHHPAGLGRPGFNGATTMSSWKTLVVTMRATTVDPLQWSHDDVVVENYMRHHRRTSWFVASMEPRRCRRGKREPQWMCERDVWASMEPRRCRRGKRHPLPAAVVLVYCFNGATTMSSWKTTRSSRRPC